MLTRLAHICIQVADIDRTIAFYRDGIGLPVQFTFMRNGALRGAYFRIGADSFIEAFQVPSPAGGSHFCLESDDIDGFIAAMGAKGIACSAKKRGADRSWQTWLRDPDGNAFEVHQYTDESMQRVGGVAEAAWLSA
jgi:catechol 2,3-dioxygenase-like lactoylglutathione lyase family enzyme